MAAGRDDVLRILGPWVAAQRRAAWKATVRPGEPEDSLSKFCGALALEDGQAPPTCGHCGRALQLFVQLDLGQLPGELAGRFGTGVVQLLYCARAGYEGPPDDQPDCWGEGSWEPFNTTSSLVRVVPTELFARATASSGPHPHFPARTIVGWERFEDLPHYEDHAEAGLVATYDFTARTVTLRCEAVGLDVTLGIDDLEVDDITDPATGDKLAGWPFWDQANEMPSCPRCGKRMQLLFQVDSNDNVPYMFGDLGVGHITQCADHHDVVAFGWACG